MSNSNETLKECCRCKIKQVLGNFSKDRKDKDGL